MEGETDEGESFIDGCDCDVEKVDKSNAEEAVSG